MNDDKKLLDIEQAIFRDPSGRGLIGEGSSLRPFCKGEIFKAAQELTESAHRVGIVTGFYVPHGTPPAAETDGPPGAVLLGKALLEIGIEVVFITDIPCENAVRTALIYVGFSESSLRIMGETEHRFSDFEWKLCLEDLDLTHLVSVERVGPSYSLQEITGLRSTRMESEIERLIPQANRNRCHNMRGELLDDYTTSLHKLFEVAKSTNPPVKTIGIGDGGNEIGMGKIPFEEMASRLSIFSREFIACRIATDWNIVAGTSNWGAMALAATVLHIAKRTEIMKEWDYKHHRSLIETMVVDGPAVDGATGRQEISVDGLPFETYFRPWNCIREILGLGD